MCVCVRNGVCNSNLNITELIIFLLVLVSQQVHIPLLEFLTFISYWMLRKTVKRYHLSLNSEQRVYFVIKVIWLLIKNKFLSRCSHSKESFTFVVEIKSCISSPAKNSSFSFPGVMWFVRNLSGGNKLSIWCSLIPWFIHSCPSLQPSFLYQPRFPKVNATARKWRFSAILYRLGSAAKRRGNVSRKIRCLV